MLLSNYKEHPVKTNYLVFKLTNPAMGLYFESLLEENNISFEKDDAGHGQNELLLYGVKTTYREEAVRLNFLAYAKYRKPLITNVYVRSAERIPGIFLTTFSMEMISIVVSPACPGSITCSKLFEKFIAGVSKLHTYFYIIPGKTSKISTKLCNLRKLWTNQYTCFIGDV